MIDHVSTTVANVETARVFYDAVLAALGAARIMNAEHGAIAISGYGRDGKPSFWIAGGTGETPALAGHVAFSAQSRGQVDAFHEAAIAAGAKDNGGPGVRPQYHENYYAAFVIDPDGNRLEAVCQTPA